MDRRIPTLHFVLALAAAALAGVTLACSDPGSTSDLEVVHLSSPAMEALGVPFPEAVRVGDMLYLSGQLGNRPGTTELVPGGIGAETRQTMENIKTVLERHGSGIERIVKCTIFLADIGEWSRMNEVYASYFGDEAPARSAVAGSGLALGARVEIDCIAVAG